MNDLSKRKRRFILDWMDNKMRASATDSDFHDAWYEEFGGNRNWYFYGAAPCPNAQRWLKKMYDEGLLTRDRFSLYGLPKGFPKWVYVYERSEQKFNGDKIRGDVTTMTP